MPEGDTIYRTAEALRSYLLGERLAAARSTRLGPQAERLVGSQAIAIEPRGKHLVISFDNGLALHVHLGLHGSWHRYAPGERWRRPAWQARLVLETPAHVLVCFNAPTVELLPGWVMERHPAVRALGPDLLAPTFDAAEALRRLRLPERADLTLGEALMDQRALAGIGNVYKSEVLFIEQLDPWLRLRDVDDEALRHLLTTAERLLRENSRPGQPWRITTGQHGRAGGPRLWVYGRAGRPCLRCGAPIRAAPQGVPPRRTYWCPVCQEKPEHPRALGPSDGPWHSRGSW